MTALSLSDGNPSARRDRSQPLHRVCGCCAGGPRGPTGTAGPIRDV